MILQMSRYLESILAAAGSVQLFEPLLTIPVKNFVNSVLK